MKRKLISFLLVVLCSTAANSQRVTFDDGTSVDVNLASFDYENIRRVSMGPMICLDGLSGAKLFTVSYLQPEKFHLAANIGFENLSMEGTFFFSGREKLKNKSFAVKYEPAGYRTIKAYALKAEVRKRKEMGVYFAVNDYGHIMSPLSEPVDAYTFRKLTQFFAGISTVNYWHTHINVDDNSMRRGQFIGRTILAPFITTGGVADTLNYTSNDIPKYGARLMYELSNTFGLMGGKIRGRTNMLLRMGIDIATDKNKGIHAPMIFGFGIVYNFAEGRTE